MNQDHHRDPTSILLLASGTPAWPSLQGSHIGYGDPSQLARPSPLRDGVPLFLSPRRSMMNGFMRGSRPRGYKLPEWWLGQGGGGDWAPKWAGTAGLGRPAWAHLGLVDSLLCTMSVLESSRSIPLLHVGPCRQFLSELDEASCLARFDTFLARSSEFVIFSG
jgi:hypothetical protein